MSTINTPPLKRNEEKKTTEHQLPVTIVQEFLHELYFVDWEGKSSYVEILGNLS